MAAKIWKFCALIFFTTIFFHQSQANILSPIRGLLQTNVLGFPIIHQKQRWVFDPDVSIKRRSTYQEVHGYKGEKFIERIGVGYDGKEEERRQEQSERDKGHLGGLNFYLD